jgi:hypothetical protein
MSLGENYQPMEKNLVKEQDLFSIHFQKSAVTTASLLPKLLEYK